MGAAPRSFAWRGMQAARRRQGAPGRDARARRQRRGRDTTARNSSRERLKRQYYRGRLPLQAGEHYVRLWESARVKLAANFREPCGDVGRGLARELQRLRQGAEAR